MSLPPNRFRDTVDGWLEAGGIGFLVLSRHKGSIWYVEGGPWPLWVCRQREKVIHEAGAEAITVRFHVLNFDPNYCGLGVTINISETDPE